MSIQAGGSLPGSGCGCPCQLPAHGSISHRGTRRVIVANTGRDRWDGWCDGHPGDGRLRRTRARPSRVGSAPACATAPAKSGARAAGSGLTPFRSRPRRCRPSPRGRRGRHRRHDHIVCRRAVLRWRPPRVPWRFRRRSIVDRLTVRWSRPRLLARRPHGFPCPGPGGRSRPHCGQTRRLRHGHRRCHGLESRPPRLPQVRDRTPAPR